LKDGIVRIGTVVGKTQRRTTVFQSLADVVGRNTRSVLAKPGVCVVAANIHKNHYTQSGANAQPAHGPLSGRARKNSQERRRSVADSQGSAGRSALLFWKYRLPGFDVRNDDRGFEGDAVARSRGIFGFELFREVGDVVGQLQR